MKPFETLDTHITEEGQRLTLNHRDGDYFIDLDGHELMSTRVHSSESALGVLACKRLIGIRKPRVLIGGLGLGFTLKATLEAVPDDAEVVQAEAFEIVAQWHREHLGSLGVPLDDPRLTLHIGDVAQLIRSGPEPRFDAILLDTDNGPDALCIESNAGMYDEAGLELMALALQPGGTLAVWSAHDDPAFVKRLRGAGFRAHTEHVRGHDAKGPRHTIFLAET
jgi:spermidine synthase